MNSIKILVVEDDPGCREVLKEILTRYDFRFHLVDSAREAIELIDQDEFDVVFTDILGVDGWEVLRLIKDRNPLAEVVVLSGDVRNAAVSIEEGATRFIAKPFSVKEVVSTTQEVVSRVLQRRNGMGLQKL